MNSSSASRRQAPSNSGASGNASSGSNSVGTGPLNRNSTPKNSSSSNASPSANAGSSSNAGKSGSGGSWTDTISNWGSQMGDMLGDRQTTIAFMVLTVIAIIVIIIYIVYKIRNRNLQSVVMIDNPLRLYEMNQTPVKFSKNKIVPTNNGQEYTYSFWLYLVDYNTVSDQQRLIFLRNDQADIDQANPVVFMDGGTNRLYIAVKTNLANQVDNLSYLLPENNQTSKYLTAVVEYVPLQRWTNIAVVLQDNLLTLFLDGKMYSVKNVHDLWNKTAQGEERPVFKGTKGDVYVGNMSGNNTPTYGFISRLSFYNYALMEKDVMHVYSQGPTSRGILARMGLPAYGLQSPIYKINSGSGGGGSGGSSGSGSGGN